MKNYKFTDNWFVETEMGVLDIIDTNQEIHILEIGSYEGKSSVWFAEKFLKNKKSTLTCIDPWTTYSQDSDTFRSYGNSNTEWDFKSHKKTFLHNIKESGYEEQIEVIQGFSHDIIPKLLLNKKKYDLIYVDGNHTAPFVLIDSVLSWLVLKEGGLIMFDDYLWNMELNNTLRPKISIDSFSEIFADYLEIVWEGYKKVIKKLK